MNKPHKHAEIIKAWADGAEIEAFDSCTDQWIRASSPSWQNQIKYRIKPEPKPDYYTKHIAYKARIYSEGDIHPPTMPNLKLCFDGETGELKSAEVLR